MTTKKTIINIAIADDQKLFREGLVSILRKQEGFLLVHEAENASGLLEQLENSSTLPDVLLLDMAMPDMNGIELNEVIQKQYPSIKVLVLSTYDQPRFIVKMIERGASGYLTKDCTSTELTHAIETVHTTGFYFNEVMQAALRDAQLKNAGTLKNINNIPVELTKREEEILLLICKELSTEEIATQLFLSNRTVDGHRVNILAKAGCKNIAGLVVFAVKNNLFTILP
ncbi:MAG: response regulator transcription factor [Bacteroidetes bacterium]|nr:response regulator transcription factor [Bacteroidota bacterium]